MTTTLPVLHTSERSAVRRCPQLWWWRLRYRMGLSPKNVQVDARWFGIGIHEALAEWYQPGTARGQHPAEFFEAWCGDEIAYAKTWLDDEFDEPVWEDMRTLGVAMLDAYVKYYGRDEHMDIIAIEQPFALQVNWHGQPQAVFRSRWDGVFRDLGDGSIQLVDHKTASGISTAYLALDDQAGAYWAAAGPILRSRGILRPKESISGVLYNFMRKSMPDTRPVDEHGMRLNKDGSVSKKQPAPAFVRELVERSPRESKTQLTRLANDVAVMNAMRDGTIPIVKHTSRDCVRCDFFNMCKAHERGGDAYKSIMRSNYAQADPYADDAKSASW